MDMKKTGEFIAALRKEHAYTQEQLGEILGVSNKTVSHWETGVYFPPADVLLQMSEVFGGSINEILTGRRLADAEYKGTAEENLVRAMINSSFSLEDRIEYYQKKWLKEHSVAMVAVGLCIVGVFVAGILLKNFALACAAPLLVVLVHAWRHNSMMTYVERFAYNNA